MQIRFRGQGFLKNNGFGVFLSRVVTPAGCADRAWSISPERAVEQGVEEDARGGGLVPREVMEETTQ